GYHLRPFGRPMIEGYFGADLAWGLEAEGQAALYDFAVSELVAALGSNMRKRLEPLAASSWGVDPFSRGAYSHALPGHAADRARLRTAIEDRIFLAGEATAPVYFGTAHGAWMEGERAAKSALLALGLDPRTGPGDSEA
ncbi:FAD-dependent oxidoreductase, partial [Brevundimonas nasdae]|uniref:FAD-dependent oxidoreductase n=1 Tax=Brevundimonas nasdae TaxID=172043 RepID=UPI0028A2156C